MTDPVQSDSPLLYQLPAEGDDKNEIRDFGAWLLKMQSKPARRLVLNLVDSRSNPSPYLAMAHKLGFIPGIRVDNDFTPSEEQLSTWRSSSCYFLEVSDSIQGTEKLEIACTKYSIALRILSAEKSKPSISNSFVYVRERDIGRFSSNECPIQAGSVEIDNLERSLLIFEENRVVLYRTNTSDFDEQSISRYAHTLGQVYRDLSGALMHEDFATDMVKLSRHPGCANCQKLEQCNGLYQDSPQNVFNDAESIVSDFLNDIQGEILDIGGGPTRYEKLFEKKIYQMNITYSVIEPEPPTLLVEFLEKNGLLDKLYCGPVETYPTVEKKFDWALVLRSHNHFKDPQEAYRRIHEGLKPGGKLLVVDNTAYGIARNEKEWKKLSTINSSPLFEHFRNDTSEEALQVISKIGFKILEHKPVHFAGANQWLCLFERV